MPSKYRNGWPLFDALEGDPVMRKGSGQDAMMDFNRRLYSPGGATSTRTRPVTTPTTQLGNGWQTGSATAIERQFQTPGTFAGSIGLPPVMGGFPVTGAAGPSSPMGPAAPDPQSVPYMVNGGSSDATEVASHQSQPSLNTPAQNAMQAHQAEAATPPEMRPISSARRFFWATGLIDGRAPLSPSSAPTDFDATFGGGATHLGGPGVTWDQRQQQNQQHVSDATKQRGLDWSPY